MWGWGQGRRLRAGAGPGWALKLSTTSSSAHSSLSLWPHRWAGERKALKFKVQQAEVPDLGLLCSLPSRGHMARAGGNLGVWGSLVLLVSSLLLRAELGSIQGREGGIEGWGRLLSQR